jgi:hypothetical protein
MPASLNDHFTQRRNRRSGLYQAAWLRRFAARGTADLRCSHARTWFTRDGADVLREG